MNTELEPDASTQFRLVIFDDGSVRTLPLTGSRWVIGRAVDCEVVLRDPTVSRRHVLLERRGEALHFRDLGGSNPLQLAGQISSEGLLQPGQTLLVGLTRLMLEVRRRPASLAATGDRTLVLSREVLDDELPTAAGLPTTASIARRVLERIEWIFADLGELSDIAEPMLDLALNLTGWQRGVIVTRSATASGGHERPQTLAALDVRGGIRTIPLPEPALAEAFLAHRPQVLTSQEAGATVERLVVPLGEGGGVLLLEQPGREAARGQPLLRLGRVLGQVLWHRLQEGRERLRLRDEAERLRFHGNLAWQSLLASSRLHKLRQTLRAVANHQHAVRLRGETGTEREELARFLHLESHRARMPFVAINLATLPADCHAEALFAEEGLQANVLLRSRGGTLFLDHGELLANELQQQLLQTLRRLPPDAHGRQQPRLVVGTELVDDPVDDVACLHPDLQQACALADYKIPPLRSEPRDVLALAELYLSWLGPTPNGSPRLLSERCKDLLLSYRWPGNTRELRQVLEAAAMRAGDQPLTPRHLPKTLTDNPAPPTSATPTLAEVERQYILNVLERCRGNRSRAAQMLGIATSTLYERLRRYGYE